MCYFMRMSRASTHALKHPPVKAPSEPAGAPQMVGERGDPEKDFPELAVAIERGRRRGRGAQSNKSGRFEAEAKVAFDDGWQSLEDLRAGVRMDVTAALLDLQATDAGVQVAQSARTLATRQLEQAQDRVRAGVTNTIELAQAQEDEVVATERYIASVHAHLLAKAAMARALGQVQQRFLQLVGGQQ